jgi:hypothetical protein
MKQELSHREFMLALYILIFLKLLGNLSSWSYWFIAGTSDGVTAEFWVPGLKSVGG